MAPRKKKVSPSRGFVFRALGWLLNPATLMVAVALAMIPLWNQYHRPLLVAGLTKVDPSRLHMNGQPHWIARSIPESAVRDSRLDEIDLERPDSIERVAAALAVQPWIRSIQSIRKTAEGFFIEVVYRKPVGIVEFADDSLIPVDDEAIVLEGDGFSPDDTLCFWRISVPDPVTIGLATGRIWDDLRIRGAVAIANHWQERNRAVGLMRIVNRSYPTGDRLRLQPYELWTASGIVVYWGSPPGKELHGEATAEQKTRALEAFVREKGTLETCGMRFIDVRDGRIRKAEAKFADQSADFVRQLK
jgi:hypothetical protein